MAYILVLHAPSHAHARAPVQRRLPVQRCPGRAERESRVIPQPTAMRRPSTQLEPAAPQNDVTRRTFKGRLRSSPPESKSPAPQQDPQPLQYSNNEIGYAKYLQQAISCLPATQCHATPSRPARAASRSNGASSSSKDAFSSPATCVVNRCNVD